MNLKILPKPVIGLLGALVALGCGTVQTRADYAASVLANNPVSYWRLNETTQPPAADVAANQGSLGAAADGFYSADVFKEQTGALTGSSDTAAGFSAGTRVNIPHSAALNPSTPFTVECWAYKTASTGYPLGVISSLQYVGGAERRGWLIYDNDTSWQFRLGDGTGYIATAGGGTAAVDTWYHVVGVFDGSNAILYVNGVEVAKAAIARPYAPNPWLPTEIGSASAFGRHFSGFLDEVAIYPAALGAAEILARYQNGTSASPATPYDQLVKAGNPLAYYRLNEPIYMPPSDLPVAANLGSAGTAGNGSYYPGMQAGAPGPSTTGLGTDNKAGGFSGVAGYVGTPTQLNDLAQFTVMGWLKRGSAHSTRGGYFGQNDLLELGDADGSANIEAWINAYGTNIKIPYPFQNDQWGFFALVGDGTKVIAYTNGIVAGQATGTVTSYGVSDYYFNIGGGGIFNVTGDHYKGGVDEVAVFDKALTAQQIMDLYVAAAVPPFILTQPSAPAEVNQGNPLTLTVAAGGSPTLTYQWRKGGTDLPGQTSPSLVFEKIMSTDAGIYDVVVRNGAGEATSAPVTLSVLVDSTKPTIAYATGNATLNGVRIWFSESVDPASAQTPANYQLSGGLTVSSATVAAPAGSPGDNIVDLVTSAQTPATLYTLTVNNVTDLAFPVNAIAENSSVEFSSWVLVPGILKFEVWSGLSTTDNSLANTLKKDPRYPNSPTMVTTTTAFSSRPVYPDDSHEGYGGKMSGYVIPPETGDYRFFLYSDDSSELYLNSSGPDPKGAAKIAEETDCCDVFQEPGIANDDTTTYPTSEPFRLEAGKRYYVEAIWKEGTGGDYCLVAWRNENDTTAAGSLPVIPAQYLGLMVDPNVELTFTTQPTDQVGSLPSTGIEIFARDFNNDDGGFTVENTTDKEPPRPWIHDPTSGQWVADPEDATTACTGPYNSRLNSPEISMAQDGTVSLSFSHRYSFESPLWDAGQVRISVNGGTFTLVPAENFSANGYAEGNIVGTGIALGQRAFNGESPGYGAGEFITSKALLGTFAKGDKIIVQFAGAWDDCTVNAPPGWVIDSLKLELVPMIIQDFSKNNGGFNVENAPAAVPAGRGPWVYDAAKGEWAAAGSDGSCTDPFNSKLTSPPYVVAQSDEVTLSFTHRYSFEADYDGGQVQISVNGGAFTAVPAESFSANGYAARAIDGNGVLKGQRVFSGDSAGYASGGVITSSAVLGNFQANDTLVVRFVGAWDECSGGTGQPSWVIKSLQLAFGKAAKASTFTSEATASLRGEPQTVAYQWQRNDGAGWGNIPNADDPTYRIFPVPADFDARFRVVASVPGKSITSNEVKLTTGDVEPPTISIAPTATGATITFTGKLQSSATVNGAYAEVTGAQSPYAVPATETARFFRSVK